MSSVERLREVLGVPPGVVDRGDFDAVEASLGVELPPEVKGPYFLMPVGCFTGVIPWTGTSSSWSIAEEVIGRFLLSGVTWLIGMSWMRR